MKKGELLMLTPRERRFAQLVADPLDRRSIGDKGLASGWHDAKYGYRVAQRKHVAAEIERLAEAHVRALRTRAGRVIMVLADKAETGDLRAIELFLEVCGLVGRGVRVSSTVVTASANRPTEIGDRIRALFAARAVSDSVENPD